MSTRTKAQPSSALLAFAAVLSALLACKSSQDCTALVTYMGKRFSGGAKGEKNAKISACLGWCAHMDPLLESKHREWKATPKGQSSSGDRFGDIMYRMPGGKPLAHQCRDRCLLAEQSGQATIQVDCK